MEDDDLKWLGGLTVLTDAKYWTTLKSKGQPEITEHGASGFKVLKIDPDKPVFPMTVQFGRTVPIGDYEFARISVKVDVIGPLEDRDDLYEWGHLAVNELLQREVASVLDNERPEYEISPPPPTTQMLVVGVDYGLTFKRKKFEFDKVDVGYSVPCSPGELEGTWKLIGSFIGEKVQARVGNIKGAGKSGSNYGL